MTRADIDRLRGQSAGRHKRNAAIADAARALAALVAAGTVTGQDIAALAAVVQRVDNRHGFDEAGHYGENNGPIDIARRARHGESNT